MSRETVAGINGDAITEAGQGRMSTRFTMFGFILLGVTLTNLCNLSAAQANRVERRVALIMGNAAYKAVSPLANPINDADAVARALQEAGFETVYIHHDLDRAGMLQALHSFEDRLQGAAIGVVYFSGHGMEINRENFLIPIDAKLADERDVDNEAVSLSRVLKTLDAATRLRLVILDACRDNRFAPVGRQGRQRSATRGLARIEPTSPNTLVAFAAREGTTATDGASVNSPFSSALLRHLPKPGLDIRLAFLRVRDDVLKATNNAQEPYIYGSLGGDSISLRAQASPADPTSADAPLMSGASADREARTHATQMGNCFMFNGQPVCE